MTPDSFWYLALIPALPLMGAAVNLLFGRQLGRRAVHAIAVGSVAAAFAMVVLTIVKDGGLWTATKAYMGGLGEHAHPDGRFQGLYYKAWTWIEIGSLKIDLAFRFDTLTAVMTCLITFVGTLIHIYSTGYMAHEPRYAAYFGYLNLFTGAMLILVLGDNLPVMFIGWEGVGLCSYLLIGFWFENTEYANAGRKAFVVNRIGDFAFILGVCLLFYVTGTLDFPALKSAAALDAVRENVGWLGGERVATAAAILLFIGACGKSAQIPLYVWLPDAMAGPTPVSALIHAATMVTSGVYMIARLSFVFASSATAMAVVSGIGALTALAAAFMAFAQTDFKKVLAYSTVSQLGFMFVGVGTGAWAAGIFHLVTHGFFKAGLFLGAGSVMHAMSGSGDITKMGGLRRYMPRTHWAFVVYCLAIAGIIPFSGFFSKDEILAGAYAAHVADWWPAYGKVLWATLSLAALGTAFYMFRLYALAFLGECRADAETKAHIHESPLSMTGPLAVLAIFTVFLGVLGLPHGVVPLPNIFHEYLLGPVVAPASFVTGGEEAAHLGSLGTLSLMGIALVLGGLGAVWAMRLYRNGIPASVDRFTSSELGSELYRQSKNKLFVDEIYEKLFIAPFRKTCRVLFEAADRIIIDTFFVSGVAAVVDFGGKVLRWFQNGQVQRYMVLVVVGAGAVFFVAMSPEASFDYEVKDSSVVVLEAKLEGAGAAGAKVEWDWTGDGKADATGDKVEHDFAGPGHYEVTVKITDGVFERESEHTGVVVIDVPAAADAPPSAAADEGGAQ